jgi:hypothetical protein
MEKPILFSTVMVQAIIKLIKKMTRRVVKLPSWSTGDWNDFEVDDNKAYIVCKSTGCLAEIRCPYGEPGDTLWVRETWCDVEKDFIKNIYFDTNNCKYIFKVDDNGQEHQSLDIFVKRWKPSIFMPRKAARLFLTVKNIRVERLQDISEEDAKDEGVKDPYDYQPPEYYEQPHMRGLEINKSAFAGLWDSINKSRGYGWDTNPYVWVVEFERK